MFGPGSGQAYVPLLIFDYIMRIFCKISVRVLYKIKLSHAMAMVRGYSYGLSLVYC